MRHSTTHKRVTKDLNAGIITEGSIRALCKALHADDRTANRLSTSRTAPKCAGEELEALLVRIRKEHPRIVEPQATKGITWLRNVAKTPKGTPRKNSPFSDYEVDILDNYSHFTLIDFEGISNGYGLSFYLPIYRVHSTKGKSLDYYAGSWQSGVNITVL